MTKESIMSSGHYSSTGLEIEAFDPELFQKQLAPVISKLKAYINDSTTHGLHLVAPNLLKKKAQAIMNSNAKELKNDKITEIIELLIETSIPVYSTGYMGRQFSGVIPLSAIIDFACAIINQPSSFYEAGQMPNIAEHIIAEEFNKLLGCHKDPFTMVSTSGGSLANLTAILTARNIKLNDVWKNGLNNQEKLPAIAASNEMHYSITRAAGILGIGSNQIVKLPSNNKGQIDINQVQRTLDKAYQNNLNVFCLIASAGNTSMGAIDPIKQLAQLTSKNNIWLHIDAAHGGALLVSDKQRPKLDGISLADSFSVDTHKMLFTPSLCTLLFYKNKSHAYQAFQQQASYVFEEEKDIYTHFDAAEKNFECTKRPTITNFWATWAVYGRQIFEQKIDYLCELTQKAYNYLLLQTDFEAIHRPEINILCFRYTHKDTHITNDLQLKIRDRLKMEGNFFISKVKLNGTTALRVVFMNHKIELSHFKLLISEIRSVSSKIISELKLQNEKTLLE